MSWFQGCRTVEDIKARYHELAKQYHPDLGGDAETMKAINAEMDTCIRDRFSTAFDSYAAEKGYSPKHQSPIFQSVLRKIIEFNIRIEIIGYWIYAFESYEYRTELKELGFWFSKKHRAWVFSGGKKINFRSSLTTDDVRAIKGSEVVRDRKETVAIA